MLPSHFGTSEEMDQIGGTIALCHVDGMLQMALPCFSTFYNPFSSFLTIRKSSLPNTITTTFLRKLTLKLFVLFRPVVAAENLDAEEEMAEPKPHEWITHVSWDPVLKGVILTNLTKSGNYIKFNPKEWIIGENLAIKSYFETCKLALEKIKCKKGGSIRRHKIKIPQGCRGPATRVMTRASLLAAAEAPAIHNGPANGPAGPPIQSSSSSALNCVAAALANGLLEVDLQADHEKLQKAICLSERDRSLGLAGSSRLALEWSGDRVFTSKPKMFLKGSGHTCASVNWDSFFASDLDASFGVFVVEIEGLDGNTEHVICLVRKREEGESYLVDGNPKFGTFRWPLTASSFAQLEVKSITYAVKLMSIGHRYNVA